jgi:hypothetical protein
MLGLHSGVDFVGGAIPSASRATASTAADFLLDVGALKLGRRQVNLFTDEASVTTVRMEARNHHVFKLDFEVFNASTIAISPEELKLGSGDRLPHRTVLEQDRGSKVGKFVEADLMYIGFAAGMPSGC